MATKYSDTTKDEFFEKLKIINFKNSNAIEKDLAEKVGRLSKWIYFGNIYSLFTVLTSMDTIEDYYHPGLLVIVIALQGISLLIGTFVIVSNEFLGSMLVKNEESTEELLEAVDCLKAEPSEKAKNEVEKYLEEKIAKNKTVDFYDRYDLVVDQKGHPGGYWRLKSKYLVKELVGQGAFWQVTIFIISFLALTIDLIVNLKITS